MAKYLPSNLRPPPSRHRGSGGSLITGVTCPHLNLRPTLITYEKDTNTEMAGGNSNHHTRPYYFRRCKRLRSKTSIESLPDDLLFNILILLPAQDIYDAARLVCRKWYNIIHTFNFINVHFQRSTSGLLIHSLRLDTDALFVEIRKGQIEISKLNYQFINKLQCGCNGLIVRAGFETNKEKVLYIANPTTNQHFSLPPFCLGRVSYYNIAYAAASKEYKVFVIYDCEDGPQCAMLTVGVDNSWRHVDIGHLSLTARKKLHMSPRITEGFVHWIAYGNHILTLNIERESITETPTPQSYDDFKLNYYLSSESCLSLLVRCRKYLWEFWEMKSETGEWMKVQNIDLEPHKRTFRKYSRDHDGSCCDPNPVGWLKYKEVLVFHACGPTQVCIAYNIQKQEIDLFEIHSCFGHKFHVHRNSLEWLVES